MVACHVGFHPSNLELLIILTVEVLSKIIIILIMVEVHGDMP